MEEIIGTREAAELLGVTTREVRRKASEGSLNGYQVEGPVRPEWRFERSEVIAYMVGRDQADQDGRTARDAVRKLESVAIMQQEAVEAGREATAANRELAERIGANTAGQEDLTGAVRDLVTALRDELGAVREERDRLRAELEEARRAPWWRRLVGR